MARLPSRICASVSCVGSTAGLNEALANARLRRRLPAPAARRQIREAAGVSQIHVARELGVTRGAVAYWEIGSRTPRPQHLAAYLAILDHLAREGRAP